MRTAISLNVSLASSLVLSGPFEDALVAKNSGDYSTALPILQRLAFQSSAEAQFQLSLMYLQGHGVKPSAQAAYRWLSQSARKGNAAILMCDAKGLNQCE